MRIPGLISLIVTLMIPSLAEAHPHAWVDVKTRLYFDDMKRVDAMEQTWLFDDLYSVFVTSGADFDGDGKPDQDALEAVMKENIQNLREYNYFTEITSGNAPIKTDEAIKVSTRMQGARLEMTFTVPFSEPVSVSDIPLHYAIYDPTYYIEMVHAEVDQPITLVDAPENCQADLKQPDPNPELVMSAAALDKSQKGADGLGRYFAEQIRISCK